jgi:LemA protein
MIAGIAIGALILLLVILVWTIYNRLVQADNQVDEAISMIDVQLKKRFELIPNLVEMVKGYNTYEAQVLEEIVAQRSQIPEAAESKAKFDSTITGKLKHFRLQVENYPDLKSNTQFEKLMDALSEVEEELAMARRYYNGTVRDLHNKMEVFPNVLFAQRFGLQKKRFYEINQEEAERPQIDLKQ